MLDGALAARQCTSAESLGFCGSAWWGKEEEGVIRRVGERNSQVLYFLLWYSLLRFGGLLEGWDVPCKL